MVLRELMTKKKKVQILCDNCGNECVVYYTGKQLIECCPFCGEPATAIYPGNPLLNTFDKLEEDDEYEDLDE